MTDYCTVADVGSLTGWTYDASSSPTTTEVGEIITDISAEMDSVLLAAEYTTIPVTAALDLALLERYAKIGAAYNAWLAGVDHDREPPNVTTWKEDYRAFLKRIADGKQRLPGQSPVSEAGGWSTVTLVRQDGYADNADDSEYT